MLLLVLTVNIVSHIPHYAVTYSTEMSFVQRVFNNYLYFVDWTSREFHHCPKLEKMVREKFKFNFPPVKELAQMTALILINTDNAINLPEPLQPNMIQVGGLQITKAKPLTEEMQAFIKKGKKGTVLMSLGTNMKSNMLGEERLRSILQVFAQLSDYNFVWKYESEIKDLPMKPSKNVMIGKFLPQNDILAHPNLIAFISHSGMLSTHEALWHGKPIIGIPIFVDQHRNLEKLMKIGVGVYIDFRTLKADNFKAKLLEVLEEPSFFQNARKISKRFQDKPQSPLDKAIWWVEYAIRNPDLENLKSPTLKLGFIASNSYDILIFLIIFLHLIVFGSLKLIQKITKTTKSKKE